MKQFFGRRVITDGKGKVKGFEVSFAAESEEEFKKIAESSYVKNYGEIEGNIITIKMPCSREYEKTIIVEWSPKRDLNMFQDFYPEELRHLDYWRKIGKEENILPQDVEAYREAYRREERRLELEAGELDYLPRRI